MAGIDTDTDNQTVDTFAIVSNTLTLALEDDGEAPYSVDLSPYLDNTDGQTLSLVTNTLSITGGNSVSLAAYLDNTDAQTLSLAGTTLSITGGNSQNLEYFEPDAMDSQASGTVDLGSEKQYARIINMTGLSSITVTLNNPLDGGAYILLFTNADDTDTVTWPASVKYEDNTAPGTGILSDGRRMVQLIYDGSTFWVPGGYN